jgi:nucleotidyltransferase substrate binding protein (TIGR01987 family)
MKNELRWKQRFSNFEKMYAVFERRIGDYEYDSEDEAHQMALIQAFEIIIELSWKTLKDYLEHQGYSDVKNGKQAIRQAFQDNIINNPEVWMTALELRNQTSHTYNPAIMKKVLNFIDESFAPVLIELNQQLKQYL